MSAISPTPSFDRGGVPSRWKDRSGLAEYLREVSLFLKGFRRKLRVGEHSRAPLRLIRFHLDHGTIWCDWVAREPDPWDAMLPARIGRRHVSLQALKDAIEARSLIFGALQESDYAQVRVYRLAGDNSLETIIFGSLRRHGGSFRHVHSLVMRAKLLGFRFRLQDEILEPLRPEDQI
ncbi:hypothetical protein DYQ86_11690 [Acidobacteria bacterium AB60]|nr:hypothetical protein DYQ86_11690 [Acidobacteria bacterium AB60]